jgi:hypothetical protein
MEGPEALVQGVERVNPLCARAAGPFNQLPKRNFQKDDGAGVSANHQEVRRQGRAGAAQLVAGQWVLAEVRERTNDKDELWLGRTVAAGEWSGACATGIQKHLRGEDLDEEARHPPGLQ